MFIERIFDPDGVVRLVHKCVFYKYVIPSGYKNIKRNPKDSNVYRKNHGIRRIQMFIERRFDPIGVARLVHKCVFYKYVIPSGYKNIEKNPKDSNVYRKNIRPPRGRTFCSQMRFL